MFSIAVLLVLAQVAAPTVLAPFDGAKATVSAPSTLAQIDTGKMKGSPVRLAWGEGGTLFLRTAESDRWGNERGRNYVLTVGKTEPTPMEEEPAWASLYWGWKSGLVAPGVPTLRFDVETREQNKTATGSTSQAGGVDNPNRSDPTMSQPAKDFASMQKVVTTTVKLKGEVIVETQNARVAPGLTFGWAPAPMGALAYVDARKRLVLMDRNGRRMEVPGATDVLLPCWSPDGQRIAYLQKTEKKKYAVNVVTVAPK